MVFYLLDDRLWPGFWGGRLGWARTVLARTLSVGAGLLTAGPTDPAGYNVAE
jgi:hypothetical protein